ncbi:tyrosine-protein kinase Tec-like [Lampetra fluviatilis]
MYSPSASWSASSEHPLKFVRRSSADCLLSEILLKRSQQKKKLSPLNYKERLFVLNKSSLCYYECNPTSQKIGSRKGCILLSRIRCVDRVLTTPYTSPEKRFPFQVIYDQNGCLYVFSPNEVSQHTWVSMLKQEIQHNACLWVKYHPHFWSEGMWLCCQQTARNAIGCTEYQRMSRAGNTAVPNNLPPPPQSPLPSPPLPPLPPSPPASPLLPLSPSPMDPLHQMTQSVAPNLPPATPHPPSCPTLAANESRTATEAAAAAAGDEEASMWVEALYNLTVTESQDLSLVAGQEYRVLDHSDEYWWKARDKQGREGFIPSNYVMEKTFKGLEAYEWYSKDISRSMAEQLLKEEGKEGGFVVRDSSHAGVYTVSIYTNSLGDTGVVKHYQIKEVCEPQRMYYVAENHLFENIPSLIHYHQHNSAGLVARLKHSALTRARTASFSSGQSSQWEIDPSELSLLQELGSGQFGVVRLGVWKRVRGNVAIKMLHEATMSEDDFIEEAKTMMRLWHPKLVHFYGVSCRKRPFLLVTEYMEAGNLESFVRERRGANSASQLLQMCADVCEAMAYLERESFLHRDLAARNCLVNAQGTVKVSDFGMSRYVLDDQYTSSSGTKFPVRWSPPEVFLNNKFSSKSDVWAFGILMWEVFSEGMLPYDPWSNSNVVEQVQAGYRLYRPERATQPVHLIMHSCWHERPEERPSFQSLLESIQHQLK